MSKRAVLALLAVLAVGVVGVGALWLTRGSRAPARQRPRLDDYGAIPPFSLLDQSGEALTEQWLRGRVTIVDFIFTRCDTICPVLTLKMARLEEQTKDLG